MYTYWYDAFINTDLNKKNKSPRLESHTLSWFQEVALQKAFKRSFGRRRDIKELGNIFLKDLDPNVLLKIARDQEE